MQDLEVSVCTPQLALNDVLMPAAPPAAAISLTGVQAQAGCQWFPRKQRQGHPAGRAEERQPLQAEIQRCSWSAVSDTVTS